MDPTERKITKIAREAGKFTVQAMKEEGIGTAEFDFIHLVRHHPGITQTEVREQLKIDKGAAARRAASLEAKGYLIRKPNPWDGRSQLLYATEKAETLKNSKAEIETVFYEWLLLELPEKEAESFCETLDKLYWKSKRERQNHFAELSKILREKADKTMGPNVTCIMRWRMKPFARTGCSLTFRKNGKFSFLLRFPVSSIIWDFLQAPGLREK